LIDFAVKYIREVALMVASRAARLSAAAIYAVLQKIGKLSSVTVAVDGISING
jgi:hexokinase